MFGIQYVFALFLILKGKKKIRIECSGGKRWELLILPPKLIGLGEFKILKASILIKAEMQLQTMFPK